MRRFKGEINGEKFIGDKNKRELHDLDNEKPLCQIDHILNAKNEIPFNFYFEAKDAGYNNCVYCLGNSKR
jgi:hypothetical protein